jgi:hypothetical protein
MRRLTGVAARWIEHHGVAAERAKLLEISDDLADRSHRVNLSSDQAGARGGAVYLEA